MSRQTKGIAFAVFSAVLFGIYPAAARMVYADGANVMFVVIVTTATRALSLLIYALVRKMKVLPKSSQRSGVLFSGFVQSISIFGIIGSLQYLPGPVMIILLFTHTLMLLLFMAWKGEAKLTPAAVLSSLFALLGLSFVLDIWSQHSLPNAIGAGLALVAAVATMSRLYLFGKQTRELAPPVVGAQVFCSASVFTLLGAFYEWPVPPHTPAGMFYTAACCISLILGTFGLFYGIALLGSFQWSLLAKMEPLFTSIFSAVIAHEVLRGTQYFGIALMLSSLAAYQFFEGRTTNTGAAIEAPS